MKRIKRYLLIIAIMFLPVIANAASITVSGPNNAVVGNTISVNVKLSAGDSWQMILNYDSSMLKLVSGGGEAGGVNMVNTVVGLPSRSYTFKFQTLKTGKATVSVSSYDVVDGNGNDVTCSISNKSISIITQAELEASYSKNNNLKNLVVEGFEITPEFDKDTLEYNVTVPENTTEVDVKAYVADSTASVTGEGIIPVAIGTNKLEIVVKAQNGDEKKYVLNVDVKDSNPIEVTVDNEKYVLVKLSSLLTKPNSFVETTVKISDVDIPAFKNDTLNITLVGLKNDDGEVKLFIYKDNNYYTYNELSFGVLTIYINKDIENIKGYTKGLCKIQGKEIDCLYKKKSDRYKIVYGINVISNEEGYYLYDSTDKNLIKYDMNLLDSLNEKVDLLTYISIGLASLTFVSLIIIICLSSKKKKNKNMYNSDIDTKIEEVQIDNNELEDNEITEVQDEYDDSFLTEKEIRKKNKKK